ncbi:hypothetical protein QAD02_016585 [Eretmocerus hayati]|uniref:Uncharacterized protein n=2 Tax=Eretmocerus hayati TaxID=131215 RepID=A0ACC2PBG7_9HYME|nr:hypothetical protein QAD02_016584 [Eretmocerus hayati]KAJ8680798.1 hypothetical protein QAD02_016585 [Eretmocerus hayati]
MKSFVSFAVLAFVAVSVSEAGKVIVYPNPLVPGQNIPVRVEDMVNDPGVVNAEFDCLLEDKRCNPLTHALVKASLKEGLYHNCAKCTASQKEAHEIIMPVLEKNYKTKLEAVRQKFRHLA